MTCLTVTLKSFGHHNQVVLTRAGLCTCLTSGEERQHRQSARESFSVPRATPVRLAIAASRVSAQSTNGRRTVSADSRSCLLPGRPLVSSEVLRSLVLSARAYSPPRHRQLLLAVTEEAMRQGRRASAASPAVRVARKHDHPRSPILPAKACSPPIHHPPLQAEEALLAARVHPGKDVAGSRQVCVK